MHFYFAGSFNNFHNHEMLNSKTNRLFSYGVDDKGAKIYSRIPFKNRGMIMIDSGAHSIVWGGKPVNVDDYLEWIEEQDVYVDYFVQLDDIPDNPKDPKVVQRCGENSWKNYLYMRKRMTNPQKLLPVFHYGEDFSGLKRMLETKFDGKYIDYIGVPGRQGVRRAEQAEYFHKAFKIIKESKNPNVKVHGFGMSIYDLCCAFPFHSVDSTTWLQQAMSGLITTSLGIVYISEAQKKAPEHFDYFPAKSKAIIKKEIEDLGQSFELVSMHHNYRYIHNIRYWKLLFDAYKCTYKKSTQRCLIKPKGVK